MDTNNFLSAYQNIQLRHIILPGSHDAGLAQASYNSLGVGWESMTVTQKNTVGMQAHHGSRFFDVRIVLKDAHFRAYHSPGDNRRLGGSGQFFGVMLNELCSFIQTNPTEFILVRLSHMKDEVKVLTALMKWMGEIGNGGLRL